MACPTCDHTMERIGTHDSESVGGWWCPRCGTMTYFGRSTAPKLVDRCRDFIATQARGTMASAVFDIVKGIMHRCGIIESIWRPEDRPT